MRKFHIIFVLISSLMFIANAQGIENLPRGGEKLVKIRASLQDVLAGVNAIVYEIARASITSNSSTSFNEMRVVDDLMMAKPDGNSQKLGRAQGHIASADLVEIALTMCVNFMFTIDEYNKNTLSIVGRDPMLNSDRELPIVGGAGAFHWANGYSIFNTYFFNPVTQYGVLEYPFYVLYREVDLEPLAMNEGESKVLP